MKRWLPHPLLSLVLWIVWLLLNNQFSAGQMLMGAILAILLPLITSRFWPEEVKFKHPWVFLKFTLLVIWDIFIANFQVAKLILGKTQKLQPAFLEIPLDIQQPIAISFLANTISLTPGTVSCDVSADRKTLLVHALNAEEGKEIIQQIKQRYEAPLKQVFES